MSRTRGPRYGEPHDAVSTESTKFKVPMGLGLSRFQTKNINLNHYFFVVEVIPPMIGVGTQWLNWTVLPPVTAGVATYSPLHWAGRLGHSVRLWWQNLESNHVSHSLSFRLHPSWVIAINCSQPCKNGTSNLTTISITRGPCVTTYITWGGISKTQYDLFSRVATVHTYVEKNLAGELHLWSQVGPSPCCPLVLPFGRRTGRLWEQGWADFQITNWKYK